MKLLSWLSVSFLPEYVRKMSEGTCFQQAVNLLCGSREAWTISGMWYGEVSPRRYLKRKGGRERQRKPRVLLTSTKSGNKLLQNT